MMTVLELLLRFLEASLVVLGGMGIAFVGISWTELGLRERTGLKALCGILFVACGLVMVITGAGIAVE